MCVCVTGCGCEYLDKLRAKLDQIITLNSTDSLWEGQPWSLYGGYGAIRVLHNDVGVVFTFRQFVDEYSFCDTDEIV